MLRLSDEEYRQAFGGKKKPKYGNRKCTVDGHTFDSEKEARRYQELSFLLRAGEIHDLELQKSYCLIPAITDDNGKTIQRAVNYVADFVYIENDGSGWHRVVEDVKSDATRTQVYKLKKKLLRWQYGIEIRET